MSYSLYREFLTEKEKFLHQLERNLQDQINRLKVEELSLLKLISSSDAGQYGTPQAIGICRHFITDPVHGGLHHG